MILYGQTKKLVSSNFQRSPNSTTRNRMSLTFSWIVCPRRTWHAGVGTGRAVVTLRTDVSHRCICRGRQGGTRSTEIPSLTHPWGRGKTLLSAVMAWGALGAFGNVLQTRLIVVCSVRTPVLCGELGSCKTVVSWFTGRWVLDSVTADGVILDSAITMVPFRTLFAGRLAKENNEVVNSFLNLKYLYHLITSKELSIFN